MLDSPLQEFKRQKATVGELAGYWPASNVPRLDESRSELLFRYWKQPFAIPPVGGIDIGILERPDTGSLFLDSGAWSHFERAARSWEGAPASLRELMSPIDVESFGEKARAAGSRLLSNFLGGLGVLVGVGVLLGGGYVYLTRRR